MAIKTGSAKSDILVGTNSGDTLNGLGGQDNISGLAGDDKLFGGWDADALFGGAGQDQLYGESGADYLAGGDNDDYIHGGSDNDMLRGENGNDTLRGGAGVDDVAAGAGNDLLIFETGSAAYSSKNTALERLDGGSGTDTLQIDVTGSSVDGVPTSQVNINYVSQGKYAVSIGNDDEEPGNAVIATASGIETFVMREDGPGLFFLGNVGSPGVPDNTTINVTGTNQADEFVGGRENSNVNLLAGDDTAIISVGKDVVSLGAGEDLVRFTAFYNGPRNGTVTDFNPDEDRLDLSGWTEASLKITEDTSGTWLKGDDDSLHLLGVTGYDPWGNDIA